MTRLKTVFATLHGIVSSAIEYPRGTVDALNLLPSLVRGLRYGRTGCFPPPPDRAASAASEGNPLLDYFNSHIEGPGVWKDLYYFDIYHRHFSRFVGREVHVLEVGIYSGGSLGMWREYFGKGCRIYGVDIEPACMVYKSERIDVLIGDQSDRSFWKRFRETVPKLDILIDDGSHVPEHQRITLEEMLPHIRPGGVYLCEDISGAANHFAAYVSGLACGLNASNRGPNTSNRIGVEAPMIPSGLQTAAWSITSYPRVTVIEKHEHNPRSLFIAHKKGTQWQPY